MVVVTAVRCADVYWAARSPRPAYLVHYCDDVLADSVPDVAVRALAYKALCAQRYSIAQADNSLRVYLPQCATLGFDVLWILCNLGTATFYLFELCFWSSFFCHYSLCQSSYVRLTGLTSQESRPD